MLIYRPFSCVIIRTCAETSSSRETTPLGGIAECGMSDYYKKLDSIAKARHLKLLGLDEKDDPHDPINGHNFVDDMTRWPTVDYGHLLLLYTTTTSLYKAAIATMEKLRCFNLFSGWIWPLSTTSMQLLHCEPKPKCTRKITLHGLALLLYTAPVLLYTTPVWLGKYKFPESFLK